MSATDLPWDAPATFFLRGTLEGRPNDVDARFGASLRTCLYQCLIGAKPLRGWLIVETEDGTISLDGPAIEAILAPGRPERDEVRRGGVEGVWEARRLSLFRDNPVPA